jgi:endonuclease/exonuclease/phosphatase (EEP) superfamily protein YafD
MRGWLASLRGAAIVLAALLATSLLIPFEPIDVISNFWPHLAVLLLAFSLLSLRARPASAVVCLLASAAVLYVCVRSLDLIGPLWPDASSAPALAESGSELKVVTFNVLNDNRANADEVRDFLIAQSADFIFLQESRGFVDALGGPQAAASQLGPSYPYRSGCEPGRRCSLLLLSKHPLRSVRRPDLPLGYNRFVIAAADVRGRAVTLVGVHLSKPLEGGLQERELALVGDILKDLPRPLILAGDFNAAPWSTALRRLLAKARLGYSYGYHPTWPVWAHWVGLPIDHVVVDGLRAIEARTWPDAIGSNHLPVIAKMAAP